MNYPLPIDTKIPLLTKEYLSFDIPQIPQKHSKFFCFKRKISSQKNPLKNTKLLSIKANSQRIIYIYEDLFLSYETNTHSYKTHKSSKTIDFCLVNEKITLILLFYETSENSLEYSFESFIYSDKLNDYEPGLIRNSYNISNFKGIELFNQDLYLYTIENIIEIYRFSNKKELFMIKKFPVSIKPKQEFLSIFKINNEIFIETMINNEKDKENEDVFNELITIKEQENQSETINLNTNERIIGIFPKNEGIFILFPNSLIFLKGEELIIFEKSEENEEFLCLNENFIISIFNEKELILYKISENIIENSFKNQEFIEIKQILEYQDNFLLPDYELFHITNNMMIFLESKLDNDLNEFDILKIHYDFPEKVLLQAYIDKKMQKAELLLSRYNFDQEKLLKKRWEISEKKDSDILEILLNISDLQFLEKASEKFLELNFETLQKFYIKKQVLMRHHANSVQKIDDLFENFKKYLENAYILSCLKVFSQVKNHFLEENVIKYKEFHEFCGSNILELFMEYLENGKIRNATIILDNFKDIIFNNYWKLFEKEGVLTKCPEKILIILPKQHYSNLLKSQDLKEITHKEEFVDYFWDLYENTLKNSPLVTILTDFLHNNNEFSELLSQIKALTYIYINNHPEQKLLTLYLQETNNLNTIETYRFLHECSYLLTGNPTISLYFLEYGYKCGGYEILKNEVLIMKLLEILIHCPGYEELEYQEFKELSSEERFCLIMEANLKEFRFYKLIEERIKGLYDDLLDRNILWQHLKSFSTKKLCSIRVFLEIFKLEIKLFEGDSQEIVDFVENYIETSMLAEHHRELAEIVKIMKSAKIFKKENLLNSHENIDKILDNFQKISEIAQILYVFQINKPIASFSKPANSEESLKICNEILQNFFLNRIKSDNLFISQELVVVDNIKSLLKVLFYLRDLYFPFLKDLTIYQVLCQKLLETSKFSLLKELLEKDKLLKKISQEIFETLILDNIALAYEKASYISQIEHCITKSLELLPNDSPIKKSEKSLWKICQLLDKNQISFNLKDIRNCNRVNFLKGLLYNLKEKAKDFGFLDLARDFAEFDIEKKEEWYHSVKYMEFLKDYGIFLLKYGEIDKVKTLLEFLDENESIYTSVLSIAYLKSGFVPQESYKHYQRLSLLRSKDPQILLDILQDNFENNKTAERTENDIEIFISDRLVLEKKAGVDEKKLLNLYKNLMKTSETSSLGYFFQDLTLNPARGFFQLTISEEFPLEYIDEVIQGLLKSGFFDLEKLIIGFLLVFEIKIKAIEFLGIEKFQSFLKETKLYQLKQYQNNEFDAKNDKKIMKSLEKLQTNLMLIRKMPLIQGFLSKQEIKMFIFDNAFRNEKLVSILFQSQDIQLFEEFEFLIKASKTLNMKDLLISKILKGLNESDENSVKSDFQRLVKIISKNEVSKEISNIPSKINLILADIQKIYEKSKFLKIDQFKLFLDVCLKEFNEIKADLNIKKIISLELLNNILGGVNELKQLVPDIRMLLHSYNSVELQSKSKCNQLYQLLEESNLFLIAKTISILTDSPICEEKIYMRFLLKKLRNWDSFIEIESGRAYDEIILEMQKFILIFPRIQTFKRMQKIALTIAKKQQIKNLDLFEIYGNIYSFVYESIKIKYPSKLMSSFLLNVPSLIIMKSKLLSIFSKIPEKEANQSTLNQLIRNFKEETLYEEETLIEILDVILDPTDYEDEIIQCLDIECFERYMIQKTRMVICEISENNVFIEKPEIIKSLLYGRDIEEFIQEHRCLMKISTIFKKIKRFIDSKGILFDKREIWKRVTVFLCEDIGGQEDLQLEMKYLSLLIVKKELGNMAEYDDLIEKVMIKIKLSILLEKTQNKKLKEIALSSNKDDKTILLQEINELKEENDFILVLNICQIFKSSEILQGLTVFFTKNHIYKLLFQMMNLGYFRYKDMGIQNNEFFVLAYQLVVNENCDKNIQNKFLEILLKENNEFIDNFTINPHIMKLLLVKGCIVDILKTDLYSTLYTFLYDISSNYSYKLRNNEKFFKKNQIQVEECVENYENFEKKDDQCWFGKSFFDVYLKNILKLVELNEYYDAAKLNYHFMNKTSNFSEIETMLVLLKTFLEDVFKERERLNIGKEIERSIKDCIKILRT